MSADAGIERLYEAALAAGALQPDPAQRAALAVLARVQVELARPKPLFGKRPAVRGAYLWGPPGRGKSLLMDLFLRSTPEPRKRRAHFHAFMAEVHGLIRAWREGDAAARRSRFGTAKGDDPIAPTADLIARDARLLCFDELMVTDIADAMILGRLFEALFERGVTLVATSNRAPTDLYRNGVNRQLFEPFITMLDERCGVVEVAGPRDWRLDRLKGQTVYFAPDTPACREAFEGLWDRMRGDEPEEPATLLVQGRDVVVERTAGGLARGTFAELCQRPLGPQDYLALAARFHTLFLGGTPVLSPDDRQAARRFVTLIDAVYEAHGVLVMQAAAPPEALYPKGDGAFEFERTVSRLQEMSSAAWMETARAPAPD
ncbi:MAG TPA: cell division protein ZapE [Caulobacteraceae bacterium]